jgi:hypothetical protein
MAQIKININEPVKGKEEWLKKLLEKAVIFIETDINNFPHMRMRYHDENDEEINLIICRLAYDNEMETIMHSIEQLGDPPCNFRVLRESKVFNFPLNHRSYEILNNFLIDCTHKFADWWNDDDKFSYDVIHYKLYGEDERDVNG